MTFTDADIQEAAQKFGTVFHLKIEDKECLLRKPTRVELGLATTEGKKNPLKFNEVILNRCWIDGDKEIQDDDEYFMGASSQLSDLIVMKEAEIKKYTSQSPK